MDNNNRKQIDLLRTRLKKLQRQLAGAEQKRDDAKFVEELKQDISATLTALEKLAETRG